VVSVKEKAGQGPCQVKFRKASASELLLRYLDTIPHANLMAVVAERICDGAILHLIQMWLKAPVMEEDKDGTKRNNGGGKGNSKGTPQGGVISPLLANL
jgi:RNA-directed DNA polymerase